MPGPSATWNTKRVFITYRNVLTGTMESGTWSAKSDVRITNTLDDGKKQVFRSGPIGQGTLNTNEGSPSLTADLPIVDDPDNSPNGGQITLLITFTGGGTETFKLSPLLEWPDAGTDLSVILNPAIVPAAPPFLLKGIPGGVAELDSEGFVIDAWGDRVTGGGTPEGVTWNSLVDKPVVIASGVDQAAARASIAVPSTQQFNDAINLTVNTATYNAGMALKADLVGGVVPVAQIPIHTSTKISDFAEAAQDAISTLLAGASGVTMFYNDTANTLTISGPGASSLDAEAVRDAIGIAMVGVGVISITVNDAADTITISSTATANSTDAALRDRSTHTGTQLVSTIFDFSTGVQGVVGLFSTLSTTVKTTLVAAINELVTSIAANASEISLLWTNANRKQDLCRWDKTTRVWEARGAGWRYGVIFLSTDDPTATAPVELNKKFGDIWKAHPDQPSPV